MRYLSAVLALLLGASAQDFRFPDCDQRPLAESLVCDVTASPSERAPALVEAMTIDEKLLAASLQKTALPKASPASTFPPTSSGTKPSTA